MTPIQRDGATHLVVRTDGGFNIGTGHMMRCLALAQGWKARGGQVTFIAVCESDALLKRLRYEGFEVVRLKQSYPDSHDWKTTSEVLADNPGAWVALDGYHFDHAYQLRIKKVGHPLLVIDDMSHLDHYYADVLLNQNINAEQLHYSCEPYTRLLLGARYVLLRQGFLVWKGCRRTITGVARKVLVTLGGGDPDNLTLKVIQALKKINIPDLEAKIVVGASNPHLESLKKATPSAKASMQILHNVEKMPELMVWADIAISAGGTTVWELAFMGVPNLVIVTADNQRPIAEQLHRLGAAVSLGWHENISTIEIEQGVTKLLTTRGDRTEMVRRAQEVVDGEGATRVLMQMCRKNITLRPIHEDDCRLLWEWANDPAARTAAFSSDQIPWEEHLGWFKHKLNEPNCFLFIAVDDQDTPVGQVRLDVNGEGEAEIDVSLDKSKRGLGYGSHIIDMAAEEMFRSTAVQTIHAFIKFDNKSSMKAFEKARFEKLGIETVRGIEALHYARVKSNEQQIFKPDILSGWQQALELSSL